MWKAGRRTSRRLEIHDATRPSPELVGRATWRATSTSLRRAECWSICASRSRSRLRWAASSPCIECCGFMAPSALCARYRQDGRRTGVLPRGMSEWASGLGPEPADRATEGPPGPGEGSTGSTPGPGFAADLHRNAVARFEPEGERLRVEAVFELRWHLERGRVGELRAPAAGVGEHATPQGDPADDALVAAVQSEVRRPRAGLIGRPRRVDATGVTQRGCGAVGVEGVMAPESPPAPGIEAVRAQGLARGPTQRLGHRLQRFRQALSVPDTPGANRLGVEAESCFARFH